MPRRSPTRELYETRLSDYERRFDTILNWLKSVDSQNRVIIQNQHTILEELHLLRLRINRLDTSQRRVAEAIITGEVERHKTVDYDTLHQHSHAYPKHD